MLAFNHVARANRSRDSGVVVAIKCLNNYENKTLDSISEEHAKEYAFPLVHPHWAIPTIYNAWWGIDSLFFFGRGVV